MTWQKLLNFCSSCRRSHVGHVGRRIVDPLSHFGRGSKTSLRPFSVWLRSQGLAQAQNSHLESTHDFQRGLKDAFQIQGFRINLHGGWLKALHGMATDQDFPNRSLKNGNITLLNTHESKASLLGQEKGIKKFSSENYCSSTSPASEETYVSFPEFSEQLREFNSDHSKSEFKSVAKEWEEAGFPPEGAPNLLACCIFAHAASNGSFVEGNRQISQFSQRLQDAIVKALITRLGPTPDLVSKKLDTEVLTSLAYGVANIGRHARYKDEVDFLYEAVKLDTNPLSLHTIGNLLAGLTMALHHHDIMEKLDEQADLALTNYGPVHPHYLAVLLKDFARLGFTPTRLLRNPTFLEELTNSQDMDALPDIGFVSLMWALAALNQCDHPVMLSLWARFNRIAARIERNPSLCLQVHQTFLAMKYNGQDQAVQSYQDSQFHIRVFQAARLAMMRKMSGTGAQRDILKCFQKLGMQAEADVLKYGIPIDVVVPEVQIAVEFDGTTKMFDNRPDIPLGKTIFKHNLIRSMGLKLIAIPLQNWTLLKGRLAQLEFLEGKLEELGLKLIKSY